MGKFIPSSDREFQILARVFAGAVGKEPKTFGISTDDAKTLVDAVAQFHETMNVNRAMRSRSTTMGKARARAEAEKIIRKLANMIRANPNLDFATKQRAMVSERPTRGRRRRCPQEPPRITFEQALHRSNGTAPTHELRFASLDGKPKAAGANRLELFVDLISPDEPIPTHPGDNHGGRPWYLRSYTRSPIRIVPPMAKVAMRVVYWARWADSTGNVGPFSASAVGWVEGGNVSKRALQLRNPNAVEPMIEVEERPVMERDPARREPNYAVAVIEAYSVSLMSNPSRPNALPAPEEEAA